MQFDYLLEKIESAPFGVDPFRHITIDSFFTDAHFSAIVGDRRITLPRAGTTKELISQLVDLGYFVQSFPGCIESIEDYLVFHSDPAKINRDLVNGLGRDILEGYGITMRLDAGKSGFLFELHDFLNGDAFASCLKEKFGLTKPVRIETAYQKNLDRYEIMPHPDIRLKALTYMVNIYADSIAETLPIHTHLMKFRPSYAYVPEFWKNNPGIDTCWVPWTWCETVKTTSRNNSITLFSPSHDTIHAVKLKYDHLELQRNQIYGNLWYEGPENIVKSHHHNLDLIAAHATRT